MGKNKNKKTQGAPGARTSRRGLGGGIDYIFTYNMLGAPPSLTMILGVEMAEAVRRVYAARAECCHPLVGSWRLQIGCSAPRLGRPDHKRGSDAASEPAADDCSRAATAGMLVRFHEIRVWQFHFT